MSKEGAAQKNSFKQICKDGWEAFKMRHPRYEGVDEVGQKRLGCGEFENGYAGYICPECLAAKKVLFFWRVVITLPTLIIIKEI